MGCCSSMAIALTVSSMYPFISLLRCKEFNALLLTMLAPAVLVKNLSTPMSKQDVRPELLKCKAVTCWAVCKAGYRHAQITI